MISWYGIYFVHLCFSLFFFVFKQKTAYEMRISDWSSDVCSSDLLHVTQQLLLHLAVDVQVDDRGIEPFLLAGDPGLFLLELDALRLAAATVDDGRNLARTTQAAARTLPLVLAAGCGDRRRAGWGKRWSVRVGLGGGRFLKK